MGGVRARVIDSICSAPWGAVAGGAIGGLTGAVIGTVVSNLLWVGITMTVGALVKDPAHLWLRVAAPLQRFVDRNKAFSEAFTAATTAEKLLQGAAAFSAAVVIAVSALIVQSGIESVGTGGIENGQIVFLVVFFTGVVWLVARLLVWRPLENLVAGRAPVIAVVGLAAISAEVFAFTAWGIDATNWLMEGNEDPSPIARLVPYSMVFGFFVFLDPLRWVWGLAGGHCPPASSSPATR